MVAVDVPGVQDAIHRVFDLYLRLRSTRKVRRYFEAHGLLFPRRVDGVIQWEPITELQISHLLQNPNYTPDYYYNRTKCSPAPGGRSRRSDPLVHRDHHEGYVTREQWEIIRTIREGNRFTSRQAPRNGAALLEGLLQCGHCNRRIRVAYQRLTKNGYLPAYVCRPSDKFGNFKNCLWVQAELLDGPVVREVLRVLTPAALPEARTLIDQSREESESVERARQRRLQQAEAAVVEARRRYHAIIDPQNTLVKADLERELGAAIRVCDQVKEEAARRPGVTPITFSQEELAELERGLADVQMIWDAGTTTNEERKQLLQIVLSRVTVRETTEEWIDLELSWAGGFRQTQQIIWRRGLRSAVEQLRGQGQYEARICETLQAQGVLHRHGRPITRHVVNKRLREAGMTRKALLVRAYLRIRELVLAGWSCRQILEELQRSGPPHWRGTLWTYPIVREYIRRLRKGLVPPEVPPLPPDPQSAHLFDTPPEGKALIIRMRKAKYTWRAIAEELNTRGLRPAQNASFTAQQCQVLFQSWRRKQSMRDLREGLPNRCGVVEGGSDDDRCDEAAT